MDDEIQETVESILGKGVKIVDCEKKSSVREEEVLLINGCPIPLEGEDGAAIKDALIQGNVPDCDLLNQILIRAGILKTPVRLETSLSVKSSVVTREEVTVARGGHIVDERTKEIKEDNYYTSDTSEIWEPIGFIPGAVRGKGNIKIIQGNRSDASTFPTSSSSSSGSANLKFPKDGSTSSDSAFGPSDTQYLHSCSSGFYPKQTRFSASGDSTDSFSRENDYMPSYVNASYTSLAPSSSKESYAPDIKDPNASAKTSNKLSASSGRHPKTTAFVKHSAGNCDTFLDRGVSSETRKKTPDYDDLDCVSHSVVNGLSGMRLNDSCKHNLSHATLGASNGDSIEFNYNLESAQEPSAPKDDALVYRDGNLISGSMNALVQHMVPTADYYPDRAYLFAFLLSSRLFIKPHELLGEVCALCDAQQHLGGKDPPSKERLGKFIPHFVQLLAEWTETFPYDFRDERVMVHVRTITQKCVTIDPSIRKEVSTLLQNLLVRLTTLEKYEEFLQRISADSSTDSLEGLSSTDVTELCASPGLLAQQLTHIELERLSYIGPEEFVQAFAKENPNLETSFKDMKKTRNLESYVSWFNRLSYLVATEVCKHVKKKQRVRVMEYWIETARECFNIGNFNSLMAIIAGLNMSPVARLKKTWNKIQSGKFSILEHQMDPSSNFSSYRSTLKAAMWRSAGATDQRQRIVIPFFSLLVKDLYFLNEGCSNKLPSGHVNFEKFWQLAKQVTEFITWKQVACPFDKCTKVITFLQASPVLTENALALASFECEPPENNLEKERYKSLK